jgi:hypothetical protein
LRQDASRQSLQPTCCQRAPLKPTNSRARSSHFADRLVRPRPSPSTLVLSSDTTSSEGAPDSPKASPIPSDAAIGAATPAAFVTALTLVRATSFSFERCQSPRRGLVSSRKPNSAPADAPCRAMPPDPVLTKPCDLEPRTLPADNPPRHPPSRSEAPSTDRSLSASPLLALRTRLGGRHWSLGLAALVQLPTRVHPHLCELGLGADRLFTGAYPGHVPPIDFCNCVDFRARPPISKLHRFLPTAEAEARRMTPPGGATPAGSTEPRGGFGTNQ